MSSRVLCYGRAALFIPLRFVAAGSAQPLAGPCVAAGKLREPVR
jgi:hypothetical protein